MNVLEKARQNTFFESLFVLKSLLQNIFFAFIKVFLEHLFLLTEMLFRKHFLVMEWSLRKQFFLFLICVEDDYFSQISNKVDMNIDDIVKMKIIAIFLQL